MNEAPPPPVFDATPQDLDHLRQLAIAFRVVGGLCAVCVNVLWLHFAMGLAMTSGAFGTVRDPVGQAMGPLFSLLALALIVGGWAVGFLGFRTARFLESRRHWNFCFGMAIVYCLIQPLGTILGVFTLIVLNRSSVKAAFGRNAAP